MRRPADDELEVTLLGRGVGESVVVHLLGDEWMVVDCFRDIAKDEPAPKRYLESMGVARSSVKHLVLTHFDTDHYQDIEKLHAYYENATLYVSAAMNEEEFKKAFAAVSGDVNFEQLRATLKNAQNRMVAENVPGLLMLGGNSLVKHSSPVEVQSIAPTRAAVLQAAKELSDALERQDSRVLRSQLARSNHCSVVLLVKTPMGNVLLGGDLQDDVDRFGWQAVLADPLNRALPQAELVKVPHHGGQGAHHEPMWERLVMPGARLLVAPFWNSHLPRPEQVEALRRRGLLWQAAPSAKYVPVPFQNSRAYPGTTGLIRARRRVGDPHWRVRAFWGAKRHPQLAALGPGSPGPSR